MPTETLAERVTHSIREQMRSKGVSQTALASKLHLSQQAISRRLTGEVELTLDELGKIAGALDTTVEALTSTTDPAPSPSGVDAGAPAPSYGAPATPGGTA